LPEAFNIAVPYLDEGKRNFGGAILGDLRHLAQRFNVVFVAGLVIRGRCGPVPPHSAAYLIDRSTRPMLMCYKVVRDGTEAGNKGCPENYTAWSTGSPDFRNPVLYRGINVGALVCADAAPPQPRNWGNHSEWNRVREVAEKSAIICVPAHMEKKTLKIESLEIDGKAERRVALTSECRVLILANSRRDGIESFITCNGAQSLPA
jgi:predicted amidohydrolase